MKSPGLVILDIFLRMGPNWKYHPRLSNLYTCRIALKKTYCSSWDRPTHEMLRPSIKYDSIFTRFFFSFLPRVAIWRNKTMLSSNPCWLIIWVGLIFFCNMEAQYLDRFENHIAIAITIHMTLIETVSLYKCLELCVRFRRENFKNWKKYQRKVWMTHISFEDRLSGMHKVFLMLPTYLTRHSTYRQENKWQKWNFLSLIFFI